jgi:hypothetical protein
VKLVIIIITVSAFLFSCSDLKTYENRIDNYFFRNLGTLLFSNAKNVTAKEMHLDGGQLIGIKIIVKGKIVKIGAHNTYMLIDDQSTKVLAVLTELVPEDDEAWLKESTNVTLFGTMKRGYKGFPYVLVDAVQKNG